MVWHTVNWCRRLKTEPLSIHLIKNQFSINSEWSSKYHDCIEKTSVVESLQRIVTNLHQVYIFAVFLLQTNDWNHSHINS